MVQWKNNSFGREWQLTFIRRKKIVRSAHVNANGQGANKICSSAHRQKLSKFLRWIYLAEIWDLIAKPVFIWLSRIVNPAEKAMFLDHPVGHIIRKAHHSRCREQQSIFEWRTLKPFRIFRREGSSEHDQPFTDKQKCSAMLKTFFFTNPCGLVLSRTIIIVIFLSKR